MACTLPFGHGKVERHHKLLSDLVISSVSASTHHARVTNGCVVGALSAHRKKDVA